MDPHADDGQLNALLDGELDAAARVAVESHLSGCAACRARYEEARRFLAGASDLLGYLDAPSITPAAVPDAPAGTAPVTPVRPGATAREEAIVLPGPGVARTAQEPAVDPSARTAKTAKERAVDPAATTCVPPTAEVPALLEPATGATPAVRPIFAQAQRGETAPEERRRVRGMPPLAWAAMLIVGVGAAMMAQWALRPDRAVTDIASSPPVAAESSAAASEAPAPATPATTATAPAGRTAARAPLVKPTAMRSDKPPTPEQAAARIPLDRPAGATRRADELASRSTDAAAPVAAGAGVAGAGTRDARPAAAGAAALAAPAPAQAPPAEAPATTARAPVAARAPAPPPAPAFRRIDLDDAVRRLSGSIRLIDGLQPARVEVGPGLLVPGAAPDREVVRVHYTDEAGRPLVLDQQPGDTVSAPSVNGLMRGDTLVTAQPDGSVRVRWVDRKAFWLSLTGAGGPDTVRMLVERIR